ncbi:MAG: FAD-dependent oxidoreductase [Lachnospiraceae bacterium]|nr:FAD-dependent oxidoreductase [Lachnospiraceae bacterium]
MAYFTKYPHVYEPIDIGSMHMKNRIQFSPIVSNHCDIESGRVRYEMLEFVSGQAQTGCGLVTIGSTPIDFEHGRDFYSCLSATNDLDIPDLGLMTDEVHRYGCNISAELIHAGQWAAMNNIEAWVPSILPEFHKKKDLYKEVTRKEMDVVIDHYMKATERCMKAGFDMVMAHFAHGNLLSGFLSTIWNQRTDKYGGSPENRWRFPLEVLEAMYSVTKGRIPIEMRVVGDERMQGGTTIEERIAFLKEASRYIDMLCVSTGTLIYPNDQTMCYNMPGYYIEPGCNVKHAEAFKQALGDKLKVSVVGGISTLEMAEDIIASGKADIVAMAKALIADDRFVEKGEHGHEEDIAPCMRCMYCLRYVGTPASQAQKRGCAMNPRWGWEYRYPRYIPARKIKKIMIVGGGPGGMMAARILADRGHKVSLYEKEDKLGGRFREASSLWLKDGFRRAFEYSVRKTMECGAVIHLNTEVTPDIIREEDPDILLLAIGAKEWVPPIPGIGNENVVSVVDVDREKVQTGQKVVICGAGLSGAECAMELGHRGRNVTIIDVQPKENLYKTLKVFTKPIFEKLLEDNHVTCMYETGIKEITDKGVVVVTPDGGEKLIEADTVVTAFGIRRDKELIDKLSCVVKDTYCIGDAEKVGQIGDATGSAYRMCLSIDS